MENKCQCGMPLNEEARCQCEPDKCIHCCTCADDCQCGCKEKSAKENEAK